MSTEWTGNGRAIMHRQRTDGKIETDILRSIHPYPVPTRSGQGRTSVGRGNATAGEATTRTRRCVRPVFRRDAPLRRCRVRARAAEFALLGRLGSPWCCDLGFCLPQQALNSWQHRRMAAPPGLPLEGALSCAPRRDTDGCRKAGRGTVIDTLYAGVPWSRSESSSSLRPL